jgi:hypothetical protein
MGHRFALNCTGRLGKHPSSLSSVILQRSPASDKTAQADGSKNFLFNFPVSYSKKPKEYLTRARTGIDTPVSL